MLLCRFYSLETVTFEYRIVMRINKCLFSVVVGFLFMFPPSLRSENVTIDDKSYQMDRLIERRIASSFA